MMTIGIGTAIAMGTVIASALGAYFTSQIGINEKINFVQSSVFAEVNHNSQRISALEEAVSTIKTDTSTIKNDIKEILRAVK